VLVLSEDRLPVVADPSPRLALLTPQESPEGERHLLGIDADEGAVFLVRPPSRVPAPDGAGWHGLREVGAELDDRDSGIAVTAVALHHWHSRHPRCPVCGTPTEPHTGGWVRRCPADGTEHYPRTDPAVIMLVIDDDDRALLGRQARWEEGWFSTLAGFVEPGESAEAAVRREVHEETDVVIGDDPDDVVYLGSQPWPFPSSLMLGYHARAVSLDVRVDGIEIGAARWFSRSELHDACAEGSVRVPPPLSIARRLIERWYGEPLPGSWERR